jgi:hypothetical protein
LNVSGTPPLFVGAAALPRARYQRQPLSRLVQISEPKFCFLWISVFLLLDDFFDA